MSERTLKLVKGAKKIADTVDAASRAFERELAQVWRDLGRQLPDLLRKAAEGSPTAIVRAARANQLRRDLRAALDDAGYTGLAESAFGTPVDRLAAQVLANRKLAGASAVLSRGIGSRLEALRLLQIGNLLDEGDEATRALWQAATRGIFGSQPTDRILDDLGRVIDRTDPQIRTLYDTSVSIYGRQVEALQAGDDEEQLYAYMGPVDDRTRPFCLKHVGRVYSRAEIDELDNGQLDNTYLTAGGYACRHIWMAVSKASELVDLHGSRSRVPEVADQLKDLREAA